MSKRDKQVVCLVAAVIGIAVLKKVEAKEVQALGLGTTAIALLHLLG